MMTRRTRLNNPYIAGRAVSRPGDFFDREDILRQVEAELSAPEQNAIVLFGQRRMGKTSILLQLQRCLPAPPFLPVYFDLMSCASQPLGQVLFEIASTIAADAGMAPLEPEQFDDRGAYFRHTFLPALYEALGEERAPVILLDEFDVLDTAEEQLPPTAAARSFFPYLRGLLDGEPRLKFVFVVGRRAEELSIDVKEVFKTTLSHWVTVLDEPGARDLIATAERQGTLTFAPDAPDRIMALTGGHPYLTQLLCHILWNNAHAPRQSGVPLIDLAAIEEAATKSLEVGENVFEWIWGGLPPAERVICAAIAASTDEQSAVTEEHLTRLLQDHGVRILTGELEQAPSTLVRREMLRQLDAGYQFFIELMRRWVAANKPLARVKEERDRVEPLADQLYRSARVCYQQGELEDAHNLIAQALRRNPNHLQARLLLGQVLLDQGLLDAGVRELEEAYRYDEQAARYPLIRMLFAQGEEFERSQQYDSALLAYERVLKIDPFDQVAQEKKARVEKLHQKQQAVERAQTFEQHHEWGRAIEIYRQLERQYPQERRWRDAIELARIKRLLVSNQGSAAQSKPSELDLSLQGDVQPPPWRRVYFRTLSWVLLGSAVIVSLGGYLAYRSISSSRIGAVATASAAPSLTAVPNTPVTLPTLARPSATSLPSAPSSTRPAATSPPTTLPVPTLVTQSPQPSPSFTAVPPTVVPPTVVPPTVVPPTVVPPTNTVTNTLIITPTDVLPTDVPPTDVPPTDIPPTDIPPTDVPPTDVPPTDVPPTDVPPTPAASTIDSAPFLNLFNPLKPSGLPHRFCGVEKAWRGPTPSKPPPQNHCGGPLVVTLAAVWRGDTSAWT